MRQSDKLTRIKFQSEFQEPLVKGFNNLINESLSTKDFTMLALFEGFLNMLTYEEQKTELKKILQK